MRAKLFALSLAGVIAGMGSAHAATDINFWHSMQGALGERVNGLVDEFNKSQSADRKSPVSGKSVSVRVALGGRRIITTKKHHPHTPPPTPPHTPIPPPHHAPP